MSTVAPPSKPLNPVLADSEHYIDQHIRRTRRSLKLLDLAAGVLTLLIGLLGFVLTAAVIDHWVVPGGLNTAGRVALFLAFLAGAAWYGWRQFIPLLRPINPVYAAQTIERGAPTLKNTLLNLLLFRHHRPGMSARVYHALEQQTALRLSTTPVDATIDRSGLLRLGYALLLIVAICAAYAVLSPKNMAASAGRVLAPWSDIPAPSRVQILDVRPGEFAVARGERVPISAEVHGLRDEERVRVRFASVDERLDDSLTMTPAETGRRYEATLPRAADGAGADSGVMQDLIYWIEAGDARSRQYKLSVFQRPTIIVQRVRYEYPAYTGFPSKEVDSTGDVRGLEGTRVHIAALANQPIKSAHVDFNADGTNDLRMTVDGDRATASFTLALRDDRRTALHERYLLRFTTVEGRSNVDPPTYRIEVTPDYAPEVRITKPEEPEREAKVDEIVLIGVEARDPDFALAQVRLRGQAGDREVLLGDLLAKSHEGRFGHDQPFVPADARLKPGDVLEYWAEAADNRTPTANQTRSERRRLKIVGGADQPPPGQGQQQPGGQPQEGGQNSPPQDGQQGGQQGGAAGQGGQPGNQAGQADNGQGEGQPNAAAGGGKGQQKNAGEQPQGGQNGGGGANNNAANPQQQQQPAEGAAGGAAGNGNPGQQQPQQQPGSQSGGASAGGNAAGQQPPAQPGEAQPGPQQAPPGPQQAQPGAQPQAGQQQSGQPQSGQPQQGGAPPAGPRQGAPNAGQPSNPADQQQKVSSDGSDDRNAFEKISDFLQGKNNQQQQQQQPEQNGQPPQEGAPQQGGGQQAGGSPQQGEQPGGAPQQNGAQPKGAPQPQDSQPSDGQEPNGGQQQNGQQPPGRQTGDRNATAREASADGQGQAQPQPGQESEPSARNASGQQPAGEASPADNAEGQTGEGQPLGQQKPPAPGADSGDPRETASDAQQQSAPGANPSPRQGADVPRDTENGDGNPGEQPSAQQPSPDSGMNRNDGNAGSGHSTDQQQGSPADPFSAQKGVQKNDLDNRQGMDDQQPPGGSQSKRESNSRGGPSGDESGGGQEGAGQKADAQGKSDAGQHEAADEGAGRADESGQGETGRGPGSQQQAEGKTGQSSGEQRGPGSRQRPGGRAPGASPEGQSSGDREASAEDGQQPDEPSADDPRQGPQASPSRGGQGEQPAEGESSDAGRQSPAAGDSASSDRPPNDAAEPELPGEPSAAGATQSQGAGQSGSSGTSAPQEIGAEPGGDAANLQYARQQTNMVLERLDEQLAKKQVDQELLNSLGWSEDELRQFVNRWKSLQDRAAKEPQNAGAKQELDAALRSLGLRPQGPTQFRARGPADRIRDLNEGIRKSAPLEYADRVRQFQKNIAEGQR